MITYLTLALYRFPEDDYEEVAARLSRFCVNVRFWAGDQTSFGSSRLG